MRFVLFFLFFSFFFCELAWLWGLVVVDATGVFLGCVYRSQNVIMLG